MTVNHLVENDQIVDALQKAVHSGEVGLAYVPGLVKQAIERSAFADRIVAVTGERIGIPTFVEFVEKHPPEGLGATIALLKRMCQGDPDALKAIKRAAGKHGGDRGNQHTGGKVGSTNLATSKNDAAYAAQRISAERDDLYRQVKDGQMSLNAAMIEAGFRPKKRTVPADPVALGHWIASHYSPDEIDTIVSAARKVGS